MITQKKARPGSGLAVLLILLILIRTISELGISSNAGALFPVGAISAVVALAAIAAAIVTSDSGTDQPHRELVKVHGAGIALGAISFWTIVAFFHFGFTSDLANEFGRMIALVAIYVLAYRLGAVSGAELPKWLNWVVGIPAFLLIAGYAAQWSPMVAAGRAAGTFAHPNAAGAFLAVGTIACMWGYMQAKNSLSLVVALASMTALLLTRSLGAIAGLAVGAVVFLALNQRISNLRRVFLILSSLAVGVILASWTGVSERFREFENFRYRDNIVGGTDSLNWRFENWRQLIDIWSIEGPTFGLGLGSTRFEVIPLGTVPHNIFIQLLVETGIVGSLLACLLAIVFVRSLYRRHHEYPQTTAAMAGIGAVFLIHGSVGNWLTYVPAQYIALLSLGAMLGSTAPAVAIPGGSSRRGTTTEAMRKHRGKASAVSSPPKRVAPRGRTADSRRLSQPVGVMPPHSSGLPPA
jgi:O-antigen ligase